MTDPIEPEKKDEQAPPVEEPVETPKAETPAEPPPQTEPPAEVPAETPAPDAPAGEAPAEEAPKKKRRKREQAAAEAAPAEIPAADAPAAEAPAAEIPAADGVPTEAPTGAPAADPSADLSGVALAKSEAPAEAEAEPPKKKREPKPACPEARREEPPDFARRVEAILFATDQPVSARRIADALDSSEGRVKEIIGELRAHYDADNRAFTVEEIAGGFQVLTRSDFGSVVKTLFEVERDHRLSQAALETLAIIAYKQPIIRAEIEDIRGVQVQPILKTLQEQGLVRIVGRAEQLGRPMLYGTTQKFLMTFGLKSAKDLPPVEELRKKQ